MGRETKQGILCKIECCILSLVDNNVFYNIGAFAYFMMIMFQIIKFDHY